MTEIDYASLDSALRRIPVDMSPAELHGQLCGQLCSSPALGFIQWLESTAPELLEAKRLGDALAREAEALLQQLFTETDAGLQDPELGFQPLLSDDTVDLPQRLDELAEWCGGFLMGLAMGGIKDHKGLPGDIPELLDDMVDISRAGSFELGEEEEDEDAYMELVEYVRMGAMLVRMELHHLHSDNGGGPTSIH